MTYTCQYCGSKDSPFRYLCPVRRVITAGRDWRWECLPGAPAQAAPSQHYRRPPNRQAPITTMCLLLPTFEQCPRAQGCPVGCQVRQAGRRNSGLTPGSRESGSPPRQPTSRGEPLWSNLSLPFSRHIRSIRPHEACLKQWHFSFLCYVGKLGKGSRTNCPVRPLLTDYFCCRLLPIPAASGQFTHAVHTLS